MRIRVLRLIARLNVGGPASHVTWLTSLLAERGYDTVLATGAVDRGEEQHAAVLERWNVRPHRIPGLGRPIRPMADFRAFLSILALLFRFRPHIVHTHTAKAGALGRLAVLVYRILAGRRPALVHTYHGHVFEGYFAGRQTRVYLALERIFARFSDRLVILSPRLERELVETYRIAPRRRFRIVPLGLDLDPFLELGAARIAGRANLAEGARIPRIGWVGRLVPVKDPDLLVRMAKILDLGGTAARYVVAGDGPLRPELERRVRDLGLEGSFELAGNVRDLPAFYAGIDVLVLTSANEGTPLAILEAFAAGVPVVATNVGGVADLLAEGRGHLAADRAPEALADGVARLLSSEDRMREFARRAHEYVALRHGLAGLVDRMDALYRELLVRLPAPSRDGSNALPHSGTASPTTRAAASSPTA